jgi:hypothetical protein
MMLGCGKYTFSILMGLGENLFEVQLKPRQLRLNFEGQKDLFEPV